MIRKIVLTALLFVFATSVSAATLSDIETGSWLSIRSDANANFTAINNDFSLYAPLSGATFTGAISAPGITSTASDGEHYANIYNSTAITFTPAAGDMYVNSSGALVWYTGSAWEALGGSGTLSDLTCSTDQIAKYNGTAWYCAADATSAGAGYTSTVPTYSDESCTAGQYTLSTSTGYVCVSSGDWNTFALTDWSNPTPTTYSLSIDLVDGNGTDKITYSSTDYTTDQTFTGLSASSSFTITADTGRHYSFSGSGCTDSSGTVTCSTDTQNSTAEITFSSTASGGSVGVTTTSTSNPGRSAGTLYSGEYTATAGAVSHAHAYVKYLGGAGETLEIGIWSSTGTFLTSGTSDALYSGDEGWVTVTLDSSITLTATDYIIGVVTDDASWTMYRESSDSLGDTQGATMGSLGDITPPTFTSGSTRTLYVDNSASDPS